MVAYLRRDGKVNRKRAHPCEGDYGFNKIEEAFAKEGRVSASDRSYVFSRQEVNGDEYG